MKYLLIVDDQEIVRAGLRMVLEQSGRFEVKGEASTGEQAVRLARTLGPDVILLDISLPGLSAFECTRRLNHAAPDSGILVLAAHAKSPYPNRILEAGASGYLTKDCGPAELLEAVKVIADGGKFIGAEAAKQLALSILPGTAESPFDDLSAREMEVMLKLTEGNRVPDIASLMCLSPKTVATYKYRIYDKLGTRSEVDLLRMAMRYGLLEAA
ncbi:MAG: response regulator [Xanthomonadales bacterium]|nr:response regulator [Xanthomonadales bacterium]